MAEGSLQHQQAVPHGVGLEEQSARLAKLDRHFTRTVAFLLVAVLVRIVVHFFP